MIFTKRPKNLFVARFIGEINIMDGTLKRHIQGDQWEACVEGRNCIVHTKNAFKAGDKICVLLRPEDLRVYDSAKDTTDNTLQGKNC